MKNLSLAMLRDSGLILDWQTVYTGWLGISSSLYYRLNLPIEEVRSFAYDSLEYAVDSQDQQALVGLIDADVNSSSLYAMSRYGEVLATRSDVTEEVAMRKWRYATMWQYTKTFIADAVRHRDGPPEYVQCDDSFCVDHALYANVPDWNILVPTNQIPAIDSIYFREEAFLNCYGELRSWLAEERQRLTEMGQMARPSAPLL